MVSPDPGSFRDPASRIVLDGERIIRLLDERGLQGWRALASSPFFPAAVAEGSLIEALEVDPPEGSAGALEHPRLPMVTYPYEWTFSMLKDAALLQLDLLERALDAGLTMKDATPYNIQFVAGRPLFIDIGSFEPYRNGEPWLGYRQFTRQFLFPLLLRSWVGVPFQPWLRGDPEGPTPSQMRRLLPLRRRLGRGGLLHVTLQARMEAKLGDRAVRRDLGRAGFSRELILTNVRGLRSLIRSLSWEADEPGWSEYGTFQHVARDRSLKSEFLAAALERAAPSRVLDLGANDGHFSRIAAEAGAHVVAVDGDEAVLDRLYRSGSAPLSLALTDLTNPSPAQGWAGTERPGLLERARPDLVVAYGVIHHLIYAASIPPEAVLDWLYRLDGRLVLEFVAPDDEMVQRLTANKLPHELHHGGGEDQFRTAIDHRFEVVAERRLPSATRILFDLVPR